MKKTDLIKLLKTAQHAEDVFGSDPKEFWREHASLFHPDTNPGDAVAEDAFKRLNAFKKIADKKQKAGTYGNRNILSVPIVMKTKKSTITITELIAPGDLCQVYGGTDQDDKSVAIKVARNVGNNDLVANEAAKLKFLRTESPAKGLPTMKHIPVFIDGFLLAQGKVNKQVVVMERIDKHISLAEMIKLYPNGMPLDDAAWMFNRLLAALLTAHEGGLVHGAVVPSHMWIEPHNHGGVLLDWSYSVKKGETVKAICPAYRDLYPVEILAKRPVDFGTDLYMAAKIMCCLLTGDATGYTIPKVSPKVLGLLRACWLGPKHRSQDAFELYDDFKKVLQSIFGKSKFKPLVVPGRIAA